MSMIKLDRVAQVAINVRDLERATAFYRDTLGLKHLFSVPNMAFFDCAGLRLMLAVASAPQYAHPASILYYAVADIEAAHAALAGQGIAFDLAPTLVAKMPDHELWMAFFKDSEDNTLALMSEIR